MTQKRVTDPDTLPITVAEAKLHCRIHDDVTDDDPYIESLIEMATEWMEKYLHRALCDQTWEYKLCGFLTSYWGVFQLDWVPVKSIVSITYVDNDGATQTLDPAKYVLHGDDDSAWVALAHNQAWPATRWQDGAVTVRYKAGYPAGGGSPADDAARIPKTIKQGIKMLVAEAYENREMSIVGTIITANPLFYDVIQPFRQMDF